MNPVALYFMARQAARDLVQNNIDLNQGIAKHASDQGLSQLQIQRVVEAANHEANALFQKTAEDKTFSFDLASLDGVMAVMTPQAAGHTVSFTKAAAALDAVLDDSEAFRDRLDAAPQVHPEVHAAALRGAIKDLDKVAARAAAQSQQMTSKQYHELEKCGQALETVVTRAREYIRRGGELVDLQKYAHALDPSFERGWDTLFGRVQEELQKLGHPYTGPLATATELMADRPDRPGGPLHVPAQIRVMNGQHALAGELRQLRDGVTFMERLGDRTREIDNFMTSVRVAQRIIRDNEDVDTTICKQAAVLAAMPDDALLEHIDKLGQKRASKAEIAAKGAVGTAIDHVGKQSIKAVVKRGTNDWIPGAYTGPGTPKTYRSRR
jgi:hypothetical protein